MRGEYEGLKAMNAVSPELAPKPHAIGQYKNDDGIDTYFLIAEFRLVGEQPPDPVRFTAKLAELHRKSQSPTGKFGFHTTSCHGKVPLMTVFGTRRGKRPIAGCWQQSSNWTKSEMAYGLSFKSFVNLY